MVCNEQAYEAEIDELDQTIRQFANRRSAFSRKEDVRVVESTNTAMVNVVQREVQTINKLADDLLKEVDVLEKNAVAHKREHMVSWAKNGLPEGDDDDFRGVRLGEAVEKAITVRREAITTSRASQLAKVPMIVETVVEEDVAVSDEDLIRLAMEQRLKR